MNDSSAKNVAVPKVTVDWYRSTPWWRLLSHSVSISWRASHLALCAAALLVTQALVGISGILFAPEEHSATISWLAPENRTPAMLPWSVDPSRWIDGFENRNQEVQQPTTSTRLQWFYHSPDSFLNIWRRYTSYPFHAFDGITLRKSAYFLWNTLSIIILWSLVGGILARRSVQELGMHITSPWRSTLGLVVSRWRSIIWSVLMPLSLVALMCLLPLLLGWISRIPWIGQSVSLALMLPVALMALGVGWVVAIPLLGFSLSTVSIVTEKQADAFDGMSRASAYVFQRPTTLFLAVIVAEWLGHFGGSIVSIVLNTGYNLIFQAFSLGSSHPLGFMGSWLDGCFQGIVPLLVTAFGFSFFWTASTAIYLVLRRDVDRAEFDLVDMGSSVLPKPLPKISQAPEPATKVEPATEPPKSQTGE